MPSLLIVCRLSRKHVDCMHRGAPDTSADRPTAHWNNQLVEFDPKEWDAANLFMQVPLNSGNTCRCPYSGGRDSTERLNDLYSLDMQKFERTQMAILSNPSNQTTSKRVLRIRPKDAPANLWDGTWQQDATCVCAATWISSNFLELDKKRRLSDDIWWWPISSCHIVSAGQPNWWTEGMFATLAEESH